MRSIRKRIPLLASIVFHTRRENELCIDEQAVRPPMRQKPIRDGSLWIVQNKTGQRLGVEITDELVAVIARINERPRQAISAYLIQDETGQPLTQFALCSRFDKARTLAKVNF